MAKLNFQQPLLQSSVTHDPWFAAQEINSYKNVCWKELCCLHIYLFIYETIICFFRVLCWRERKLKDNFLQTCQPWKTFLSTTRVVREYRSVCILNVIWTAQIHIHMEKTVWEWQSFTFKWLVVACILKPARDSQPEMANETSAFLNI